MKYPNADHARVAVPHRHLTMMALYLAAFTGMFSETALNIALPQLSSVFGIDTSVAQWMVIGYMLVIGIVLPFASILTKHFPLKNLVLFAIGAFFVGSIISAAAPNFGVALFGRLIQGIGTGLALPLMFALVLEVTPPAQLGSAMGLMTLIIMFAPAVGPTLSGMLLGMFSWRAIFLCFALVLAVAFGFGVKFLVNPYELTRPKIDVASCVLSIIGFGALVSGSGLASLYGWSAPVVIGLLVIGVLGVVFYARRQLTSETPILNLCAFKISKFTVSAILVMLNFGITLSAMFLLPQFIQNAMGIPVALAGLIMLPGGIINAVVSLFAGRLYDRVGAAVLGRLGFCLSIIGAIMLLFTGVNSSIPQVILAHVVLMVGVPMAMSPCQSSGLNALPPAMGADGSTILNTMQQVWGALCTAFATSLLGAGSASAMSAGADAAASFASGCHWGYIFTLVLAACGFILSWKLHVPRVDADEAPEHAVASRDAAGRKAATVSSGSDNARSCTLGC